MPTRTGHAVWLNTIQAGNGEMDVESGAFSTTYSFGSRFESDPGSNPEEVLGAAHAACFSMALSLELGNAGYSPQKIDTNAAVSIEQDGGGFTIKRIHLITNVSVANIEEGEFQTIADAAKAGCPVSKALAGPEITLAAKLV